MSTSQTPVSAMHPVYVRFAEELNKRTDGRVTTTIYHSNSLLSTKEAYDGVISGIADITYFISAHTPGRFVLPTVLNLPFMVPSCEVGTRMAGELLEKFPEMRAEYAETHYLWPYVTEAFPLNLTEKAGPVRTLEDLKGKKLGGSPTILPPLTALGATPLVVGIRDRYLSCQTGVVDGLCMGWAGITGWSLHEVTKYHTDCGLMAGGPDGVVMNLDTWNSLPPDIQKIITELSAESGQYMVDVVTKEGEVAKKIITDIGGEVIELEPAEMDRWVEKTKPLWDEWASKMDAKGLPGRKVLEETIQLVEKYR